MRAVGGSLVFSLFDAVWGRFSPKFSFVFLFFPFVFPFSIESFPSKSEKNKESHGLLLPLLLLFFFCFFASWHFKNGLRCYTNKKSSYLVRRRAIIFVVFSVFVATIKPTSENNFAQSIPFVTLYITTARTYQCSPHATNTQAAARFYGEADDVVQKARCKSSPTLKSTCDKIPSSCPVHLVGELCDLRRRSRSGG